MRDDPVTTSAPTIGVILISAAFVMRLLGLQLMQATVAFTDLAYAIAPKT